MIDKETIDAIFDATRIEEVIGDFVTLKKRGANLLGLCPFHNEKTPSFTVSPTKGIFKCFGCGESGNAVHFLMKHEHLTYPEAIKQLGKKYGIEIAEKEQTPEDIQAQNIRESLYHINAFAQKHFTENLFGTDEGKSVGLTYFKERGFNEAVIKKFQLGYSPTRKDDLVKYALQNGYLSEQLENSGLGIKKDTDLYDRFRERVIFPIHNLTGRVVGFGGRILTSDKNKPKYINSPETEIYNKSHILYGIYFAKNSIASKNSCYLVEGYTDVLSLHQAGIENVVASSGTSLTTGQVRLIKRFTNNITILYDGDPAGIKASLRGVDIILEEGLNVKVVLFPEGEDPDSFARKNRTAVVEEYIAGNAKNFIIFKTGLLLEEAREDPAKKAALIREIVDTIALIPDAITRSVYIKECAQMMDIAEQTLINSLNKILRKKFIKKTSAQPETVPEEPLLPAEEQIDVDSYSAEFQERDIVRLLLNYGPAILHMMTADEKGHPVEQSITVAEYIVMDIKRDELLMDNPLYQKIFSEFDNGIQQGSIPAEKHFINHSDPEISGLAVTLLTSPFQLSSNWEERRRIYVKTEDHILEKVVPYTVLSFKLKKVDQMLREALDKLNNSDQGEEYENIMLDYQKLHKIKTILSKQLGERVIN